MTEAGSNEDPFVSVIVPVYNDPEGLQQTLESLTAQTYPQDRHEVIVVDNGSTDDTPTVAHRFSTRHDHVTWVVESTIQGSYAARNRGVRNASGSILAFIDADMTVDEDWLARVVEAMDGDVEYLACDVDLYVDGPETLPAKFNRLSGFHIDRYVDDLQFAPTCCLVVDASVFDEVGLFDSRLVSSGDLEFGNRVHESGRTLHFRPDIRMYHPTRDSIRSLLKKSVRIGRGRYQLRRLYPERYGSPLLGLVYPGSYLPPPPWRMDETFRDWNTLSLREKLLFYSLSTASGFARTYGKLREAVAVVLQRRFGSAVPGRDEQDLVE